MLRQGADGVQQLRVVGKVFAAAPEDLGEPGLLIFLRHQVREDGVADDVVVELNGGDRLGQPRVTGVLMRFPRAAGALERLAVAALAGGEALRAPAYDRAERGRLLGVFRHEVEFVVKDGDPYAHDGIKIFQKFFQLQGIVFALHGSPSA